MFDLNDQEIIDACESNPDLRMILLRMERRLRDLESPAAPQVADGPISDIIRRFDALVACVRSNGRVPQSATISWGVDSLTYGDLIALRNWAARTQDAEHDAGSLRVQMSRVCKELDSAREAERGAKTELACMQSVNDRMSKHILALDDPSMLTEKGMTRMRTFWQRWNDAPTPAAPCTNADLVSELCDVKSRLCGHISEEDHDVLTRAALALAETKAVEKPVLAPECLDLPSLKKFLETNAPDELERAFPWCETLQGHHYWRRQYDTARAGLPIEPQALTILKNWANQSPAPADEESER